MSDERPPLHRVGVVGGGQLALMMGEEAPTVGVELVVLATSPTDPAVQVAASAIVGGADDEAALRRLGGLCEVVTFDHELVDLDLLVRLEQDGVVFRPSPAALRFSVDKAFQREDFTSNDLPVPHHVVVRRESDLSFLSDWSERYGAPPVLKAARGGYDGRGVVFPADDAEALAVTRDMVVRGEVVVEERVTLLGEVSQIVARSTTGRIVAYPLVTTVQSQGMCVEVRHPVEIAAVDELFARVLAERIAEHVGLVGVMAVEYFVTPRGLLINELALRPHNSGHWTIEGARTSQFANHLRAVSGQEVGSADALSAAAVMVNVIGAERPGSIDAAKQVAGVAVHDYRKDWRPGRKLGHVTAIGDDLASLHVRAWSSARAYGTDTEEA